MKMNILKEKRLDVETPFCSSSTESSFGLGHLRITIMTNSFILYINTKIISCSSYFELLFILCHFYSVIIHLSTE